MTPEQEREYAQKLRGIYNAIGSLLTTFEGLDRADKQKLMQYKISEGSQDVIGLGRAVEHQIKLLNNRFAEEK